MKTHDDDANTWQQNPSLAWSSLKALEPQLQTAEVMARNISNDDGYCPVEAWHNEVKPLLRQIFNRGRKAHYQLLSQEEAYDIAYRHLYKQLPVCRACPWCQEEE